MTRYSAEQLRDGAVSIFGALDYDTRSQGISPRRLPAWTRPQLPGTMDAINEAAATCAAVTLAES